MAESQRKPRHTSTEDDEEAQKKRDRRTLLMFLVIGILVVIGMVALSMFLSGQS